MEKEFADILDRLPYGPAFRFVDGLTRLTSEAVEGFYTFQAESDFYKGHFKDVPVTPGVLLTECCAQIGLVCLGIYLSRTMEEGAPEGGAVALTESQMEFLKPVYPGERVQVRGEKVYFRFNKLKAKVRLYNANGELACRGQIAGIFKSAGK
ncbi:3-hydroxyacyl-ACP dehydratase FabZ family protein [Robiginitalea sp.]|uniref:3-hydroxyacyl-ACP dehydratase FabZ family protein n=1 Tax=Robiginitalea sp. TaxID=1902411 RepID=UPI003C76C3BA